MSSCDDERNDNVRTYSEERKKQKEWDKKILIHVDGNVWYFI